MMEGIWGGFWHLPSFFVINFGLAFFVGRFFALEVSFCSNL